MNSNEWFSSSDQTSHSVSHSVSQSQFQRKNPEKQREESGVHNNGAIKINDDNNQNFLVNNCHNQKFQGVHATAMSIKNQNSLDSKFRHVI